jgi:hypothetical protein
MTAAHEEYIHLRICIDRLHASWKTLKAIESDLSNPLSGPAFRYALVEYSTAFTISDGNLSRRKLSTDLVPDSFRELHDRVLTSRHTVQAHADLRPLDAEIYIGEIDGEKHVGLTRNYLTGLEEMENLSQIIALIEGVLDQAILLDRALEQSIES